MLPSQFFYFTAVHRKIRLVHAPTAAVEQTPTHVGARVHSVFRRNRGGFSCKRSTSDDYQVICAWLLLVLAECTLLFSKFNNLFFHLQSLAFPDIHQEFTGRVRSIRLFSKVLEFLKGHVSNAFKPPE